MVTRWNSIDGYMNRADLLGAFVMHTDYEKLEQENASLREALEIATRFIKAVRDDLAMCGCADGY